MQRILLSFLTLTLGFSAFSQISKDELDIVQTIWGKNKKALTMEFLQMNEAEAATFGPIYDAYLESRKKVTEVRAGALQTFADNQGLLDDATAQKMVSSLMKNNDNLSKLQSQTFKKISKALSPAKAAQWWQLESYIDAEIKAALLGELPLLQPLKK